VPIPDPFRPKPALRRQIRPLLAGAPGSPHGVLQAFEEWLTRHPAIGTLAIYSALPGEVDLSPVVIRHPDRTWLYPRVTGDSLTLHAVDDPASQLLIGSFGIREPAPELPAAAIASADAIICPGLAFDHSGGRLGRGRGFYDRLLANIRPGCLKVGICHPFQIVPDTFPEPHDIPMDLVITAPTDGGA
jgi:5-formyltetrahydrofolate cyclo-ligase